MIRFTRVYVQTSSETFAALDEFLEYVIYGLIFTKHV